MAFKDNQVVGIWPYFVKQKFGLKYCSMPHLTPYLGPLILQGKQRLKYVNQIGREKKILNELVDQLPKTLLFVSQGVPNWKNWQPLSWRGFKQTTRYTYRIHLNRSTDDIQMALSSKTRNQIQLAESKVTIRQTTSSNLIYKLTQSSFKKQNKTVPYSNLIFDSFYENLDQRNAIYSVAAYVADRPVASALIALDKSNAYLLATGRENNAPPGSVTLLIWNCILEAKNQKREIFDFEGSMIQNIESFFRSFGGVQTPYHRVYKTSSKWSRLLLDAFNRL